MLQVRQGEEPEIQADSCSRSQSLPTKFRVMGNGVLKFMGHVDPGVLGGSTWRPREKTWTGRLGMG